MKALVSASEAERLDLLREYGVLDTDDEPAFDEIAELALRICEVPTSLITFVDARRQWFKARIGFEPRETPRELSFCAHAILDAEVTTVADAAQDPRFADNPLVTGPPFIRFYAGAPLIVRQGHALGTLAVVDYRPRRLSETQVAALGALGRQVVAQLELRHRIAAVKGLADSRARSDADRHRAILESALDAIITMDDVGDVVEFNRAAERIFGYSQAEAIGKPVAELIVPPSLRKDHLRGLRRYLEDGQPRLIGQRVETTGMRRDGTEFPAELSIQRIGRDEPKLFTGFIRDITAQKQLEAQLRQAQKMEALGQLAGGVAHDFNNLLTVIQGHVALATGAGRAADAADESLEQIGRAAQRAADLTRHLLAFSRRQVLQRVRVDLNAVVDRAATMLRRVLGESIVLSFEPASGLPTVLADESMLEQVVVNLAVNARDAMPSGGQIRIRTDLERDPVKIAAEVPGSIAGVFVRLSVSDTGHGIPADLVARVFEPFFTTKEAGKGTGLGLSTVFGIVQQHHGWIDVASEPRRGTRFDVHLPAVDGLPEVRLRPTQPAAQARTATVLLVEDEDAVRKLAHRVLAEAGYTVLEAADGVGALETWRVDQARIDLLITDMVMPGGVSGRELATVVLGQKPGVRAILTSGYALDVDVPAELRTHIDLLPKPYVPHELLAAVRRNVGARL